MENARGDTWLSRRRALHLSALVLCAIVAVTVAIRRSPPAPPVVRFVDVEVAPSLEEWLSDARPEGYSNWCDDEEDVVDSWPNDHRCLVAHVSILVRAMRPTERPSFYTLFASDLCLSGSRGTTHDGVVIVFGRSVAVVTPSLYTSDRASLITPWRRDKRFPAIVVFAVPLSSVPDRFALRYGGYQVASFELGPHGNAVAVGAAGLD